MNSIGKRVKCHICSSKEISFSETVNCFLCLSCGAITVNQLSDEKKKEYIEICVNYVLTKQKEQTLRYRMWKWLIRWR